MTNDLEKLRKLTETLTSNGYLTDQAASWEYAFDSVRSFVCITNTDFKLKYVNKPLRDKLNIQPDDFINIDLYNILGDENIRRKLDDVDEGAIDYPELFIVPFNGWYDSQRHNITTANGKLIGYLYTFADVTQKRITLEELLYTNNLLSGVLDAIPDSIIVLDTDYNIIKYNEATKKLLNVTSKQLEGSKCFELTGRSEICNECQTKIAKETKKPASLERFVEEAGRWFDCRSYPILDKDGNVTQIIEHLRDITEYKIPK